MDEALPFWKCRDFHDEAEHSKTDSSQTNDRVTSKSKSWSQKGQCLATEVINEVRCTRFRIISSGSSDPWSTIATQRQAQRLGLRICVASRMWKLNQVLRSLVSPLTSNMCLRTPISIAFSSPSWLMCQKQHTWLVSCPHWTLPSQVRRIAERS